MATVTFSPFIQQLVSCPTGEAFGNKVREVLDAYFEKHQHARGCLLDEQGSLRPRLWISVDGVMVTDRIGLSDPVHAWASVYTCQAPLDTEYAELDDAPYPPAFRCVSRQGRCQNTR